MSKASKWDPWGYWQPFTADSSAPTQFSMHLQGLDQLLVIHFNLAQRRCLLKPDAKHPHMLSLYNMNLRRLKYPVWGNTRTYVSVRLYTVRGLAGWSKGRVKLLSRNTELALGSLYTLGKWCTYPVHSITCMLCVWRCIISYQKQIWLCGTIAWNNRLNKDIPWTTLDLPAYGKIPLTQWKNGVDAGPQTTEHLPVALRQRASPPAARSTHAFPGSKWICCICRLLLAAIDSYCLAKYSLASWSFSFWFFLYFFIYFFLQLKAPHTAGGSRSRGWMTSCQN